MAVETSLPEILSSFTSATEAAFDALPEISALLPPENGITLLDTKNEIFLSYLQGLALRNLSVIRALREGGDLKAIQKFNDDITRKLVEYRVYLERGVRSLEGKMKYQVDKVVAAAEEADRAEALASRQADGKRLSNAHDEKEADGSNDEDDNSDGDDESDEDVAESGGANIAASAYRANAASFAAPKSRTTELSRRSKASSGDKEGVYRPPRISGTSMPTTDTLERRREQRRRPVRSATLDEFVAHELSTAPVAEPSIGSTLAAGGRQMKSSRQIAKEQERREYEETNLVRLPKASRKERAMEARREGGRGRKSGYGGEEWAGLGSTVDRIGELTRSAKGAGGALERSRKRARDIVDGPRGDGMGSAFEAKKRKLAAKKRR